MTRSAFEAALADLRRAQDDYMALGPEHPLYAEMDKVLLEAGGKRLAKMKRLSTGHVDIAKAKKVLGDERVVELLAPIKKRGNALVGEIGDRLDAAKKKLNELALLPEAPSWIVHDPNTTHVLESVSPWLYSTQTDSEGYARNHATLAALRARHHKVQAEIERKEGERPSTGLGRSSTYRSVEFVVRVHVASEIDVEILKRLPGPGLREEVRLAWANGANPRVFNPFLPHGYEEREGINYFGCDLRAEKCPKCGLGHGGKPRDA